MELNFLIDINYLIYLTLRSMGPDSFSSQKYQKDVVNFQDFAWEASQNSYNFLIGRITPNQLNDRNIKKTISGLSSFLKKIKSSPEFKKILQQTRNYLQLCQKQWDQNFSKTSKYIIETTGLKLDKKFTIYITHPSLKNGNYIGDNKIAWGHSEEWPNYITVYLWHEILHSYFGYSDIDHAVIELITDEELRCVLNNDKYPPFVGYPHLEELKRKILPKWKSYLNSEKKEITFYNNGNPRQIKTYCYSEDEAKGPGLVVASYNEDGELTRRETRPLPVPDDEKSNKEEVTIDFTA